MTDRAMMGAMRMGTTTAEVIGSRVIAAALGPSRPSARSGPLGPAAGPTGAGPAVRALAGIGPRGPEVPGPAGAVEPLTPQGIVDVLARLQAGADAGRRGEGVGPVNRLLSAVVGAAVDDVGADREFAAGMVTELAKRYLRAVRGHARGTPVPRAWQEVIDRWDPATADPGRIALAGGLTLVGLDLAPAVVSICTLLGRTPGPAERADVQTIIGLIAHRLEAAGAGDPGAAADDAGLGLLLSHHDAWRQAEHLWALRGRPSEAEVERSAMDWRAGLVARGLLAGPG
ncbi:DUF5995 family protein [Pseudonocardia sp.]|jgi:hypothetical protein|uniref:DUF5995 family protein n=1 Tax=Pseudonocardia sp. TaxID=60912 RepID=UPI0031FC2435